MVFVSMTLWEGDNQYEFWKQKLFLDQAIITVPVTQKQADGIVCTSPTNQIFFIFIALALSTSWHTVGNQEILPWGGVEGWGEKAYNCNRITIKTIF